MTDIFHEVQEDLRRERVKALWDRFGSLIIGVALLIVIGVGGWRGYEYYEARQAAAAGDAYQAASRLAAEDKLDEARAAFAEISKTSTPGYQALARLREADLRAKSDKDGALKLYQAIVDDGSSDPLLRDAARARGAFIAVDVASLADVRKLADPLAATPDGAWAHLGREAIGLAAYKAGELDDARRQFEAIVADAEAPGSARQRADLVLAVLPAAKAPEPAKPTN